MEDTVIDDPLSCLGIAFGTPTEREHGTCGDRRSANGIRYFDRRFHGGDTVVTNPLCQPAYSGV